MNKENKYLDIKQRLFLEWVKTAESKGKIFMLNHERDCVHRVLKFNSYQVGTRNQELLMHFLVTFKRHYDHYKKMASKYDVDKAWDYL